MITENETKEILRNIFNIQVVEYTNEMNVYKIGIWLNGLEINFKEIELNTISDKLDKLIQFIAKALIDKIKERDIDKESEIRRETKIYEEEPGLLEEDKI